MVAKALASLATTLTLATCALLFGPTSPAQPAYELRIARVRASEVSAAAAALRQCETLACLRDVYAKEGAAGGGRFNFPHFFIVGWQKCATSSLWRYLIRQPQVHGPSVKEPLFFQKFEERTAAEERRYVREVLGAANATGDPFASATFEGSTTYVAGMHAAQGGGAAALLRRELPWLKIVASLREPISRAISWGNHLAVRHRDDPQQNCLRSDTDLFPCLRRYFNGGLVNYSYPLSQWIKEFPRDQLFILQYENLLVKERQVLRDLNAFLGLDPPAPGADSLPADNVLKKFRPEGWRLRREEYAELVELVRPDGHRVAQLLAEAGLGGGPPWIAAWEAIWEANLKACQPGAECVIQVT